MRSTPVQLAFGFAGAVVVLWASAGPGFAMVHLGLHNVVAAECWLRGEVWQTTRGEVFAHWPPLFPALLAAGRSLGASYEATARALNAASLALTVVLAMQWVRMLSPAPWVVWLVGALLVLQPSLVTIHATLASEPLFLALLLGALVSAQLYAERHGRTWIALATALAALACLQRYVGVVAVWVIAAVGWWTWPKSTRWRDELVFLVGSAAPLALWLVRNLVQCGSLTGSRPPSDIEFDQNFTDGVQALQSAWSSSAVGSAAESAVAWTAVLLALVGAAALLAAHEHRGPARWLLAFPLVYLVFLVSFASWIWLDPLDARLLAPFTAWTCIVAPFGLQAVLAGTRGRHLPAQVLGNILAAFIAVAGLSVCAHATWERARSAAEAGAADWVKESELFRWLQENPLEARVYSNAPEAYALASWRPARLVPTRRPIDALLSLERTEFPLRLVWFDPQGKFSLSNAKAAKLIETRVVREFADGVVLDVELRVP
jgi:4-amino-4-deoxy-L-arabinose transferase-like glycosyltransferase